MERVAVRDRPSAEAVEGGAGRGIAALDPVPPIALVLAGVTSIQFGAAIAATLFDDAGPGGASLLRLGFAALVLVALWRPRLSDHRPEHVRLAIVFGVVLGSMNVTFYEALDRIPLGTAVTIEFLGPIAVATLLSHRRLDLLWVLLAACGVVLLAAPWSDVGLDGVGVFFALCAATFWGLYIVIAQRASRFFNGGEGLAIASVAAAAVALIPGVAQAGADLLSPELLALGFVVAMMSSVIPYSLETEALRRIPANVFGVLMSLEPAVAALAGLIVLGQDMGAREILAIALVVAASIGVTRGAVGRPSAEASIDA
jgi:inner membrane transporter RhtA